MSVAAGGAKGRFHQQNSGDECGGADISDGVDQKGKSHSLKFCLDQGHPLHSIETGRIKRVPEGETQGNC